MPIDFLALLGASTLAYYLRVNPTVQHIRPAVFTLDLPYLSYLQIASIVSLIIIIIGAWQGMYVMQVTRRPLEELARIFSSVTIGVMIVIVYIFLRAELFQSRFILLAAYVLGLIFVAAGRYIMKRIQMSLLRRGYGVHRVAMVGNGRFAAQLGGIFRQQPQMGYEVVGDQAKLDTTVLERLQEERGIDEVVQTDPNMSAEDNVALLDFCDKYKIDYKYVPDVFEAHAAHVRFRQLGGVPVMELLRTPLDGWGRVAKRAMDIFGAIFGLVIFAPVLLSTALAIKMNSAGPVLYGQIRIGRNKKPFRIFKFRSMYLGYCTGDKYGGGKAEQFEEKLRSTTNERTGPLFKMKQDPRITKAGRFIRHWRIDELPQFINVLKGEMSLLGPRPHLPNEVAKYEKHHQKLFTIKPGMSGMAQVNGNAGLPFDQEANLDIRYVEAWSLKLDLILLFKTFWLLIRDKNAV